jgi:hypothetical protein
LKDPISPLFDKKIGELDWNYWGHPIIKNLRFGFPFPISTVLYSASLLFTSYKRINPSLS